MISLIIPVYNQAPYIGRLLDSILSQTYHEYEIIIVDDGSSDDLDSALAPYQALIQPVIYQKNGGASAARNIGWRASRGEYIAFYDADDWLVDDQLLAQQVAMLEAEASLSAVHSGWYTQDVGSSHLIIHQPWLRIPQLTPTTWLMHAPIRLMSMLFRRSIVVQLGGFNEQLRQAEDSDFVWRMALEGGHCAWYCSCTNVYWRHPLNTTSTKPHEQIHATFQAAYLISQHPRFPWRLRLFRELYLYNKAVWAAFGATHLNDDALTVRFLRLSLKLSPYQKQWAFIYLTLSISQHYYRIYGEFAHSQRFILNLLKASADLSDLSPEFLAWFADIWGYYICLISQDGRQFQPEEHQALKEKLFHKLNQQQALGEASLLLMLCWSNAYPQGMRLLESISADMAECGLPLSATQQARYRALLGIFWLMRRPIQQGTLWIRQALQAGLSYRQLGQLSYIALRHFVLRLNFYGISLLRSLLRKAPTYDES